MAEYETMTYHRESRIGYITLNRPQALNAVNDQFEEDIAEALLEFDMDEEAWVAIIHGEGRAFCAGADIKQRFVAMTPRQSALRSRGTSAEGYLARSINWKPFIAAVHGYCLGAGLSLAGHRSLDDSLSKILGLPKLENLRRLLASEPVVSNRRL